jgi:UDPglucose--hexose-1-phosphate uridylyltransferase
MNSELQEQSHRRLNILTGEWLLVSPHRNLRPWQGQEVEQVIPQKEHYLSDCYLCPGNTRSNGNRNPEYESTFLFDNDFAALLSEGNGFSINEGLLQAVSEKGICKVLCFSPDHSLSLAQMSVPEIKNVVDVWQNEYNELAGLKDISYIQIFENKGTVMGCSNPHPHGQIWAQASVPDIVLKKDHQQKIYFNKKKSNLLKDYLLQELKSGERIIFENKDFVALVPFWAVWPFETMIIPKNPAPDISLITDYQKSGFAEAISKITSCYDKIFNCSFPYSSGIHQAPVNSGNYEYWHWHMSFYPPLLRSATVKKFMVGYEMFAMPQRDITAEKAAGILRSKL